MAAKEIKSISVAPAVESETISLWQTFGWELKSNQEIKNKDSRIERRGDNLVSVTETEHYVKLTFERDPERQNYAELKSLEDRYQAQIHPGSPPKRFGLVFAILIGISLFFGIGSFTLLGDPVARFDTGVPLIIIMGLILITPGILIIVSRIRSYPKRLQPWEADLDLYTKNRSECLERAKSLV